MQRSAIGFVVFGAVALACGTSSNPSGPSGSPDSGGTTAQHTITISGFTFSPNPITVPAGATITVINSDTTTHTATSEAAATNYTPGAAPKGFSFNTSVAAGATETISVPTGLASGTVQPYFCSIHKGMMKDPNPTIIIE